MFENDDIKNASKALVQIKSLCDSPHWDADRKYKISTLATSAYSSLQNFQEKMNGIAAVSGVERVPGECPKCHSNNASEVVGEEDSTQVCRCVNCNVTWTERNGAIV